MCSWNVDSGQVPTSPASELHTDPEWGDGGLGRPYGELHGPPALTLLSPTTPLTAHLPGSAMGQSCSPANSTRFPLLRPCQLLVQSKPPGPLSPDHHSEVGVTRWKFTHALEDLTEFPHATRPCIQISGLRKPHSAQTLRLHPHPPRLGAVTPSECFSLCLQTGPPGQGFLDSDPLSDTSWLCDPGQLTLPPGDSISSAVEWN